MPDFEKYSAVVWGSYGLTFVVLCALVVYTLWQRRDR